MFTIESPHHQYSDHYSTSLLFSKAIHLSTCLSIFIIRLSISICIYLSMYLSIYLCIHLSTYLSIYLSIYPFIYISTFISIYLSNIYPSNYLSIYTTIYPSIYPIIYLSTCLFIYLSNIFIYLCTTYHVYVFLHLEISAHLSLRSVSFSSLVCCHIAHIESPSHPSTLPHCHIAHIESPSHPNTLPHCHISHIESPSHPSTLLDYTTIQIFSSQMFSFRVFIRLFLRDDFSIIVW